MPMNSKEGNLVNGYAYIALEVFIECKVLALCPYPKNDVVQ
jgi:hypothetical protein